METLTKMSPLEVAEKATSIRGGWKNIFTEELCRRAGLGDKYQSADEKEAEYIIKRAGKSFGLKII